MYQIAICDDDAAFAAELQALLTGVLDEKNAAHRIELFPDPAALMSAIEGGARYDLLFQDVLFDTERGIGLAKLLRRRRYDTEVVFVTGAPQYAVESYEAYPLNFLVKPVSREKLAGVMEHFLEKHAQRYIFLQTGNGRFQILCSDVLYFEVYDHEVVAHLTDGGRIPFKGTLRELEDVLPTQLFVRCHRCYLINLEHVRRIAHDQILFSTGDAAPVSRRQYPKVMRGLNDYTERNSILFRQSGN